MQRVERGETETADGCDERKKTRNNNTPKTTTLSAMMMTMMMMMPNRRQNKNVFVLLAIGLCALGRASVPSTDEGEFLREMRERLGSSSSSSSKISASSLGKTLWQAIRPEGELCSKTMIYDDYVLFSTMVVNENVYVGALSFVWVPVPWPASLVLAKTVLAFARANRNVLKAYAGVGVGFVLMKVLKKFVMVVKLVFALIALKLFTGESFGWILITLASHGAFAYLVLFERFPRLKNILSRGKRHRHRS